jgi:hypothetical protein
MRGTIIITVLLCFALSSTGAFGQRQSSFALELSPQVSLPLGSDADTFKLGGGASFLARWNPPALSFLGIEAGGGGCIVPVQVAAGKPVSSATLSLYWPCAGVGVQYKPLGWLSVGAHALGGYFFASTDAPIDTTSGSNPMFAGGIDLGFQIGKTFSVGLGGEYRDFLGLYHDLSASLSAAYHFLPPREVGGVKIRLYSNLEIERIELDPVFPVLFKYYDDHPVGRIILKNKGKVPIEGIKVELFVNQYMDNPKASVEIPFLKGGQEISIDLFALFNDKVLGISEATKVQASLVVSESVAGEQYGAEKVETLRLYDRNAITWSDDRRVAAFVAAKDPSVMRFSKNISSAVKGKGPPLFPDALLEAIAVHEALALYGMSYQTDPSTPYTQFSKDATAIDYLQFPAQSLQFKAGDCDDLSILNAALLESLGVETAFITVPGHIYMAFGLGISPAQAATRFPRPSDLIVAGDKVWVPVEITLTKADFLKAWETGAEEWRTAGAEAKLYPVHEAWSVYEPVGFASSGPDIAVPDSSAVIGAFSKASSRIVERDLPPQESSLKAKIKTGQDDPRLANSLGVLYARYGLADKAEAQFKAITTKREYAPALANLANLRFMTGDMAGARDLYLRADKALPRSPITQLGLARVSYELGDYAAASRYYGSLKSLDPTMAAAYAYLESGSETSASTRAADASGAGRELVWNDN